MSDRTGADLGTARGTIQIGADLRGVDQAARALTDFDKRSRAIDQGLDSVARGGAVFGGVLAAGVGLAVRSFASFESQMAAVGAVSGATGAELQALSDLARQIGKDTTFSASEAAAALEELAKAGVSTEDILNGAAAGATSLAAAAGTSVPNAAMAMANALNIFNLEGEQAVHVADVFAAAANKSATSVDDLALGLAQSGTVAAQFGVPIEEAVGFLAALADAGIKGSDAGTSFRTMLLSLLDPTTKQAEKIDELGLSFFDAEDNFIGLEAAAGMLQERLAGLSEGERTTALAVLFGSEAIRAANVLYDAGAEGIADYTTAVNDAGAAQRQAEARLDTLAGSFEQLTGSVGEVAIEFGENLAPAVRAAADGIGVVVDAFGELPEGAQTAIVAATALAAGLALTAAAGAKAIGIGRDTVRAWRGLADAFRGAQQGCDNAARCLAETGTAAQTADRKVKPLLGTLGRLAGFAATGVAIVVVGELLEAFGPDLARDIDNAIAGALDAAGLDSTADAIRRNVAAAAEAADLSDVAVELGFEVDKESAAGVVGDIEEEFQELTEALHIPGFLQPDIKQTDDVIEQLGVTIEQVPELAAQVGLPPEEFLAVVADLIPVLDELGITWVEANEAARDAGLETEEWLRREGRRTGALRRSTEEMARVAQETKRAADGQEDLADGQQAVADGADEAADSLRDQALETINTRLEQEALNEEIRDLENAAFLGTAAAEQLYLPFTRGAEDAREATEEFNRTVEEMSQAALAGIAGLEDIAPELDGVQTGFSDVGASAAEMALDLANADVLDLTESQRQALGLAEFLGDVEKSLARVEGELANNADDLSMWNGRLGLVTDTVGGNAEELNRWIGMLQRGEVTQEQFNAAIAQGAIGPFAELDALLASGAVSQREYNEAKEAAIFLIQRSAGALQDERAEQALLLDDLAEYVRLHDEADGAVKDLTDSQKGFLAALQSSEGALFLQQLQVLSYLAAVGQIPEEKVTEFIANAAAANPVVAGIVADLELLGEGVEVPITARDEATPAARDARLNVEKEFADPIEAEATLAVEADDEATPVVEEVAAAAAELVRSPFVGQIDFEHETARAKLVEISRALIDLTGSLDAADLTIDLDDAAVRDKIAAVVGEIDEELLTPDFLLFLDADESGALDAVELATLAIVGFEGTYSAFLGLNADDVHQKIANAKAAGEEFQGTAYDADLAFDDQGAEERIAALRAERDALNAEQATININDPYTPEAIERTQEIQRRLADIDGELVAFGVEVHDEGALTEIDRVRRRHAELVAEAERIGVALRADPGNQGLIDQLNLVNEQIAVVAGREAVLQADIDKSRFDNVLTLITDDLNETFGPRYTAFLDTDPPDGHLSELEKAQGDLEGIARRWTAFLELHAGDTDVQIDFIQQRLNDLGRPVGINAYMDATALLAVIHGINATIDEEFLDERIILYLDADDDGVLTALELSKAAAGQWDQAEFEAWLGAEDGYSAEFEEFERKKDEFEKEHWATLKADDQASPVIDEVNAKDVEDKEATVRTEFETVGAPSAGGAALPPQTVAVVLDDAQARADVAAFAEFAATAFATHHLLVLGVEDDVAIADLQTFQAALGAFSAVPVPPRVVAIDDDQAILDLQAFQTVIAAFSAIPVPPRILSVDDDQAVLDLQGFAEALAAFAGTEATAVVGIDAGGATAAVEAVLAALAVLPDAAGAAAAGILAGFGGLVGPAGDFGDAAGTNFAYSFASAIARGSTVAFNAAYQVALAAYNGIKAALGISSPSTAAMDAAAEITAGLVLQLRRDEGAARDASERYTRQIVAGIEGGAADLSVRSVLSADRTAPLATAGAAQAVAGGGIFVGSVTIPITVSGASDPEATANLTFQRFAEAWDRAEAGGFRGA